MFLKVDKRENKFNMKARLKVNGAAGRTLKEDI